MELIEAVKSRKTIRAYKPTPVPREVLGKILEIAVRAPSGVNSQPWEFTVFGGKKLEELKAEITRQHELGVEPHPDFPPGQYSGVYRDRRREVGFRLYDLLGIKREDKEKREQWTVHMRRAFEAPNLIVIAVDQEIASNFLGSLSLGAVMQTICLVALEYGLGTALLGAMGEYPGAIREIAGLADSKKVAICVAIGYPDWNAIPNKLQTIREPLDKITTWVGF
jgi:nitroreductase